MKNISEKLLTFLLLIFVLTACSWLRPAEKFAANAPVKKMVFDLPFPNDLIYQATPDAKVIVGTKVIEANLSYEISGFDVETGRRLWQLPFEGKLVGQTQKQILVSEYKTSTVYFVAPRTGEITRRISPAPIQLTRINFDTYIGMAFTDEMYLTTQALYTSIFIKLREKDESFPIGITAQRWANNEKVWFVPPDGQLVIIGDRPLIFGDKVLIMNAPYGKGTGHSYKIVSLKTGEELFRNESNGKFHYLADKYFIEITPSFVRQIEPLTGKELWKIEADFHNALAAAIGNQISFHTANDKQTGTKRVVEAETGKLLKQFELPHTPKATSETVFITKDNLVLFNVTSTSVDFFRRIDKHYNYWVAYDTEAKKVLWRTDFESYSASSLFPFASDKVRFE